MHTANFKIVEMDTWYACAASDEGAACKAAVHNMPLALHVASTEVVDRACAAERRNIRCATVYKDGYEAQVCIARNHYVCGLIFYFAAVVFLHHLVRQDVAEKTCAAFDKVDVA